MAQHPTCIAKHPHVCSTRGFRPTPHWDGSLKGEGCNGADESDEGEILLSHERSMGEEWADEPA